MAAATDAADVVFLLGVIRHHHDHHQHHHRDEEEVQDPGPIRRRRRPYTRSVWVRDWLQEDRRRGLGHYYKLLDMEAEDDRLFRNYTRIQPQFFMEVLEAIEPVITKQDTNMRSAIEPGLKLAVTLRYLATGDSFISLSYNFVVSDSTISRFLPQVMSAIIQALHDRAFTHDWTRESWKAVADKFATTWNMPHTLGALDGKHVRIRKPAKSGSEYYNYKGFFSIPMLALVDAEYKFLWVEFGGKGHMSDAQIFLQSSLRADLEDGTLQRPHPCPLTDNPDDTTDVPYFIVSDDAFALKDYCMKPYSKRTMSVRELIFNYRLSRARRVVENAFGILAQRFRIYHRPIDLHVDTVRLVMQCTVVLHNLLVRHAAPPAELLDREKDGNVLPGVWRQHLVWEETDRPPAPTGRGDTPGKRVRNILADYFGSPEGIVPWQWDQAHVRRPTLAVPDNEPPRDSSSE